MIEMNFIMNDQHIINIYFAPEYYSENKVRFDNSNYSENLVNLSPTLLGATVKFYVKSNDKELFVAAGTNPVTAAISSCTTTTTAFGSGCTQTVASTWRWPYTVAGGSTYDAYHGGEGECEG